MKNLDQASLKTKGIGRRAETLKREGHLTVASRWHRERADGWNEPYTFSLIRPLPAA